LMVLGANLVKSGNVTCKNLSGNACILRKNFDFQYIAIVPGTCVDDHSIGNLVCSILTHCLS
jgi:hypothetical protein